MRLVLIALMGGFVALWWRRPRMPLFAVYTVVLICQTLLTNIDVPNWGWSGWVVVEPLALMACCAAVLEAYWWSTEELQAIERRRLASGLLGIAVLMAAVVSFENGNQHGFLDLRLMLHAGLFGFMLFGALYLWRKPFAVERNSAWHYALLTAWLGLRVVASKHSRNHYYMPGVAALYLAWISLYLRHQSLRFFFGESHKPSTTPGQ